MFWVGFSQSVILFAYECVYLCYAATEESFVPVRIEVRKQHNLSTFHWLKDCKVCFVFDYLLIQKTWSWVEDARIKKQNSQQVFMNSCGCVCVQERVWGGNSECWTQFSPLQKIQKYMGCVAPDCLVPSVLIYVWEQWVCRAASESLGFWFTWQ